MKTTMTMALAALAAFSGTGAHALQEEAIEGEANQGEKTGLPVANPDIWTPYATDKGDSLIHRPSGAVCVDNLRGLQLKKVVDYFEDGNNSGCHYEKMTEAGPERMIVYVYTYEGAAGPTEYQRTKKSVEELGKVTPLTITQIDGEGDKCAQKIAPELAKALAEKDRKDNPDTEQDAEKDAEQDAARARLGVAMYNFDIPQTENNRIARNETTLFTLYQTGKWIVKTQVSLPAGTDSADNACRYAFYASIGEAKLIKRD